MSPISSARREAKRNTVWIKFVTQSSMALLYRIWTIIFVSLRFSFLIYRLNFLH